MIRKTVEALTNSWQNKLNYTICIASLLIKR
jgi:hypothetical protein